MYVSYTFAEAEIVNLRYNNHY